MKQAIVAIAAVAAASAGCQHAGAGADAAQAAASASSTVGHARLEAFVPTVAGWQLLHSMGADLTVPSPSVHVRAKYTQGLTQLDLELTDTGGDETSVQALSNIAGGSFHQEAPNGYMKGAEIGGFPAVESYNSDDKLADVTVLIRRRFIVHASASGVASVDPVREFVAKIDLSGIGALDNR